MDHSVGTGAPQTWERQEETGRDWEKHEASHGLCLGNAGAQTTRA